LKTDAVPFTGFKGNYSDSERPREDNSIVWFIKTRFGTVLLVEPAKAFITEMGPFLIVLNPAIRTEPNSIKQL